MIVPSPARCNFFPKFRSVCVTPVVAFHCASNELGCSLSHASSHDLVEHIAEESEPLLLGDLAVTIGVEGLKELVDLILVHAGASLSLHELEELSALNGAVSIDVKTVEGLLGLLEGISLSSLDLCFLLFGEAVHSCFLTSYF